MILNFFKLLKSEILTYLKFFGIIRHCYKLGGRVKNFSESLQFYDTFLMSR